MRYWLMKSEPDECSIDDLKNMPERTVSWTGIRNYQARNYLRDLARAGDRLFFYHSGCAVPGIAGVAEIVSPAYPDPTQFDPSSPYFDPKSDPAGPRWLCLDVRHVATTRLMPLKEMRACPELAAMRVLQPANRLSVSPVDPAHWQFILERLRAP